MGAFIDVKEICKMSRIVIVPFVASILLALSACGPAEEMPEPVEDPITEPEREEPGTVPETDPDTPDNPGDPIR